MRYDYLIVGAGFFGSVTAERIANELDSTVLLIDKRPHIGGNCYDLSDNETGIVFHKYGTHVFHTSSKSVWDYISKFTEFNNYRHQVFTTVSNRVYPMPVNLETINHFYNLNLKPFEAREFLRKEIEKEGISNPKNFEEKAITIMGKPLYKALVRGYTIKQWMKEPRELSKDIIDRLPVRYDYRKDYFINDRWQGIPLKGYSEVFKRMLESKRIHLELNCDYFENQDSLRPRKKVIYTGPIDRYFDFTFGRLEWRSSMFEKETKDVVDYQGTAVMNFGDVEIKHTRIHEPRHLHPERVYKTKKTIIYYETSDYDPEEPYYPVMSEKNLQLMDKYRKLARKETGVIIGGRLGEYAYYNMDVTILAALRCFQEKISKEN
jgi:UDP-galactopyranose mutase